MNDNLKRINESVEEIREIVGAECSHISELPELVRSAVNKISGGYNAIIVFSSRNVPIKPNAQKLDIKTSLLIDLDDDWVQTGDVDQNAVAI